MKYYSICLLLFFTAFAQAQTIDRKYPLSSRFDAAHAVLPVPSGGYMMFGRYREDSASLNHNLYLMQVDAAGNPVWQKNYGDPGVNESCIHGLCKASDGWVFSGNKGNDGYIAKANNNGVLAWETVIKIPNASNMMMADVAAIPGGGYITVGYEGGCSGVEMVVARVSETGEVEWVDEYESGEAYGVYVTATGGSCLVAGSNRILKIKTSSGIVSWEKEIEATPYGELNTATRLVLQDITPTRNGYFAVAGTAYNNDGVTYASAFYVAEMSELGDFKWDVLTNESLLNEQYADVSDLSSLFYSPDAEDLFLCGTVTGRVKLTRIFSPNQPPVTYTLGAPGLYNKPAFLKYQDRFLVAGGLNAGFQNMDSWFYRSVSNAASLSAPDTPSSVFGSISEVQVFPNPVAETIQISFGAERAGQGPVRLFGPTGALFQSWNLDWNAGNNAVRLQLPLLPAGIYYLSAPEITEKATVLQVK